MSVHWYANNEHGLWDTGYDPGTGTITMADDLWLRCLMEVTPKFGPWCESLRALLAIRSLRATLHRLIHPHAVRPVKYGGEVVHESVLSGIWAFLTAYIVIAAIGAAVVAAFGYDLVTAISSSMP